MDNRKIYTQKIQIFAPPGKTSELVLGGIALARESIGLKDLDKEKFIENPKFKSHKESRRLYKTRDLARFNQNGEIEFLIE